MFLIRYSESNFIDAEKISWLGMEEGFVQFSISGEPESIFTVESELKEHFLNHIQAINKNIENVQAFYLKQEERLNCR